MVESVSDPDPPHARAESDTVLAPPENLEVTGQRTRRLSIGWPENDENVLEMGGHVEGCEPDLWRSFTVETSQLIYNGWSGMPWRFSNVNKEREGGSGARSLFGSLFHTWRIGDSTGLLCKTTSLWGLFITIRTHYCFTNKKTSLSSIQNHGAKTKYG